MTREFHTQNIIHAFENIPIEIIQDNSLVLEITLEYVNDIGKLKPFDLTDAVVLLTVRKTAESETSLIDKVSGGCEVKITDAKGGTVDITFRPEDTSEMDPGKYVYDIKLEMSDGRKYTPVKGDFQVIAGVTRLQSNLSSGNI